MFFTKLAPEATEINQWTEFSNPADEGMKVACKRKLIMKNWRCKQKIISCHLIPATTNIFLLINRNLNFHALHTSQTNDIPN